LEAVSFPDFLVGVTYLVGSCFLSSVDFLVGVTYLVGSCFLSSVDFLVGVTYLVGSGSGFYFFSNKPITAD
jgi:hypothetical protein